MSEIGRLNRSYINREFKSKGKRGNIVGNRPDTFAGMLRLFRISGLIKVKVKEFDVRPDTLAGMLRLVFGKQTGNDAVRYRK